MVRHNVLACARDIIEGIRPPRVLRARNRGRSCFCCYRLFHLRTAAQTLPVAASLPRGCTRDGPTHGRSGSWYGEHEDTLQRRGWGLPPRLQAAGNGASTWDGISASPLNRSFDGHQQGNTGGRHRRGGSEAPVGGSMYNMGPPGSGSTAASGRGLLTSMFSNTPVPSSLPRRHTSHWDNRSEMAAGGNTLGGRNGVPLSPKLRTAGERAGMWDDIRSNALTPAGPLGQGQPASERRANNRSGSAVGAGISAMERIYGDGGECLTSGRG